MSEIAVGKVVRVVDDLDCHHGRAGIVVDVRRDNARPWGVLLPEMDAQDGPLWYRADALVAPPGTWTFNEYGAIFRYTQLLPHL